MAGPRRRGGARPGALALLVLFGLCLGLAVAEMTLRLFTVSDGYHFPSSRMTDARFTNRAGQTFDDNGVRYRFDADGFRSGGATPSAGSGTILFIGDSFTE